MVSCDIIDEYDDEYYIWKIPSVSSIPHVVGYVVQSSPFSFEGTSWTLKMYPNGDSQENEGYTSLTIERLEKQSYVVCYLFYKNIFNKEIYLGWTELYDSEKEKSIPRLMQNLQEISQDSEIIIDDTFYFVINLSQATSSVSISPTTSAAEAVGRTCENASVVGEMLKEYEEGKTFDIEVSDIPRRLPSDYHIQSPQISFSNAKWILKLRPYHQLENSEKANFDIILERLKSHVPVHHVRLSISSDFDSATKKMFLTFDSRRIQSPAFEFQLKELNMRRLKFYVYIRQLKATRIYLEPQKKLAEKSPGYDKEPEPSMTCVKCKALQDYKTMFFEKADCDVTFRINERELYAHKLILKYRSPVLASAMRYDMKEKITGVIEIEDCDSEHFSDFLHFIYCGEVENLRTENVFSLFTLADKYEVLELKNVCRDFIKRNLTIDTFCDTLTLALLHSEADLIKLTTEFFTENIKQIIVTVKWQNFLVENPIQANELFIKAHNV